MINVKGLSYYLGADRLRAENWIVLRQDQAVGFGKESLCILCTVPGKAQTLHFPSPNMKWTLKRNRPGIPRFEVRGNLKQWMISRVIGHAPRLCVDDGSCAE
jgi:hypothetical protein